MFWHFLILHLKLACLKPGVYDLPESCIGLHLASLYVKADRHFEHTVSIFKISIKDFFLGGGGSVTNINMKVHVNATCCCTCRKIPGINEYVKK